MEREKKRKCKVDLVLKDGAYFVNNGGECALVVYIECFEK